jgi:hypothetical protein
MAGACAAVAEFVRSYLVRVGLAYAFLGLGLALYFAAQGRSPLARLVTRAARRCRPSHARAARPGRGTTRSARKKVRHRDHPPLGLADGIVTRLLVGGVVGSLAPGVLGGEIDSLFALMACGLVSYGVVMVAVMRRELGLCAGRN